MEDVPVPSDPSEPTPLTEPGSVPAEQPPAWRMTLEEWEASQPFRPLPRVARNVIAHCWKGFGGGPRSSMIERTGPYVRPNWVQIFRDAAAAHAAAARQAADPEAHDDEH